jgi:hypothetical protein
VGFGNRLAMGGGSETVESLRRTVQYRSQPRHQQGHQVPGDYDGVTMLHRLRLHKGASGSRACVTFLPYPRQIGGPGGGRDHVPALFQRACPATGLIEETAAARTVG